MPTTDALVKYACRTYRSGLMHVYDVLPVILSQSRALERQLRRSLPAKDTSSIDEAAAVVQAISKIAAARKRKGQAAELAQTAAMALMDSSERKRLRFCGQMSEQPHTVCCPSSSSGLELPWHGQTLAPLWLDSFASAGCACLLQPHIPLMCNGPP